MHFDRVQFLKNEEPEKNLSRKNQIFDALPSAWTNKNKVDSGRLPKDWLTANVSPIYKGGQRVDPKNFPPVSLTSTCLKVMERIIKLALSRFVDSKQIMSTRQHGFWHGRSCLTNFLYYHEQLTRALDRKSGVDVIYFDFRKAFDCVPHLRLLQKLDQMGIAGRLHSWIQSFLTKRTLRV